MELDTTKAAHSPFLIGLFGAIVALRGTPGASWPERAFNVVSGSMISGFLSPAMAEYFGLTTVKMQAAAAFAVGLLGLNLVATLVVWLKDLKLSDVLPWTKRG